MNSLCKNSATRAGPSTRINSYCSRWQFQRLGSPCIVPSTSDITNKAAWGAREGDVNTPFLPYPTSKWGEASRAGCFHIMKRQSRGKDCSVTSSKGIFMCTGCYEETFYKTNINIWYLKVFFFFSSHYFTFGSLKEITSQMKLFSSLL